MCMPNAFELYIVAFGAWYHDGVIDVDLQCVLSNVHPPPSSLLQKYTTVSKNPTTNVSCSGQRGKVENILASVPEDESESQPLEMVTNLRGGETRSVSGDNVHECIAEGD